VPLRSGDQLEVAADAKLMQTEEEEVVRLLKRDRGFFEAGRAGAFQCSLSVAFASILAY
jgi:hypothetical protein